MPSAIECHQCARNHLRLSLFAFGHCVHLALQILNRNIMLGNLKSFRKSEIKLCYSEFTTLHECKSPPDRFCKLLVWKSMAEHCPRLRARFQRVCKEGVQWVRPGRLAEKGANASLRYSSQEGLSISDRVFQLYCFYQGP